MLSTSGSVLFWHMSAFSLACVLGFACVVWTYHRRDQYAAQAFLVFLLVTVAWNATVLLRIVGPVSLAWELHLIEQFFQVLITIVWFYFAAVYAGYRAVLTRRLVGYPLAGVAVAMLLVESFPPIAAITNTDPTTIEEPFTFVTWTDTALAGVVEVLALAAFAVGSGLILYKLLTANYVQAWQIVLVFVATTGTILVEVFEDAIPHAVSGVDYPALAVTGVGVSYVVGLYRYDLFGYTPVDMSDVIDGITAPVVVLNPEQRVVDFNAPAKAMFGALATGCRGDVVLPAAVINAVPVDTPEASEAEVTLSRDGEDRVYRLYAAPLDSFGDNQGVAVTLRDVTTQRRQQEKLALLKQILTRSLRHNIRNNVDIVKANSQELIDNLNGPEQAHAHAVYDAADDLHSISTKTRVMKDVAENRGRTTPVALCELLTTTVAEYEQTYPSTTFVVDCPPACSVETTPDIEPAVRNLIENAAEHNSAADAEVQVSLEQRDDAVVIEIADNGPGIPPNELTVLERGREDVLAHGSGIGLWIVTMVVDEIDGTITYETGDAGTTITLRLNR
ncbi:ATP-binding protein [Natronomonas sp. F2-12]|jgi:signal transduction histidine kinase|uniref:histidine kinase n=1 Tax=Natronomonas aquatica TaxID=2841590 RepID=A0A9R1CS42_9EURY|nr:ATP-binding protein [Natronomonas aquatica]MCQ4334189.1 ATP-binding protein [Natronomonas aquatica]